MAAMVLRTSPQNPEAIHTLGLVAMERKQNVAAEELMRRSTALSPSNAAFQNNLGELLRRSDRFEEARVCFSEAVRLQPDFAEAHYNMGLSLRWLNRMHEAIAAYRRAVAIKPQQPDFHFNLGLALLHVGNYPEGFAEYEWRWQCKSHKSPRWNFQQPQWRGEDIAGKTILLHAEQGYGDTIQFCRYAPLVAARGAKVVLEVQSGLERLMRTLAGVAKVIVRGENRGQFDCHCPLMSLPLAFGTTIDPVRCQIAYLAANPIDVEQARMRLDELCPPGRRVGLVWAGRATHANDRNRSVLLSTLAPMWSVPRITFVSLQQGDAAHEAEAISAEPHLVVLGPLRDFAETTAVLKNLDLLISVDTAIVHLAGALGKQVWMLNPFIGDWRWEHEHRRWYPTLEIFKQAGPQDWSVPIWRLHEKLLEFGEG